MVRYFLCIYGRSSIVGEKGNIGIGQGILTCHACIFPDVWNIRRDQIRKMAAVEIIGKTGHHVAVIAVCPRSGRQLHALDNLVAVVVLYHGICADFQLPYGRCQIILKDAVKVADQIAVWE